MRRRDRKPFALNGLVSCVSILVACALPGCVSPQSGASKDLSARVLFACNQTLLRDVVASLDEQVQSHVALDSRLNEVADLGVSCVSNTLENSFLTLSTALNILRTYIMEVYNIPVDWRVDGETIVFFFAGSDEEYAALRKRDK